MSKPPVHKAENSRPKRKKWWVIALWIIFALLLICALVLYWVWENRNELIENRIIAELERAGFQAELSITELGETGATAEDIRIKRDGELLIEADQLDVDYVWREAMEGRVKRVVLRGPRAKIVIDETGKWVNPLGAGSGGGGRNFLPPEGISIIDGYLDIQSPIGNIKSSLNGEIKTQDYMTLTLEFEDKGEALSYGDFSTLMSGTASIRINGRERDADVVLKGRSWRYKNMGGDALNIQGERLKLDVQPQEVWLRGPLNVEMSGFKGKAVIADNMDLNWQGSLGLTRGENSTLLAEGRWDVGTQGFEVIDPEVRNDITRTLSLYNSLSRTPVTRDFAKPLKSSIGRIIKNPDLDGAGIIEKSRESITVDLEDIDISRKGSVVAKVFPRPGQAEYSFDRSSQQIKLNFDASLQGAYPMDFKNSRLVLKSTNGRNIRGTESFSGQVTIPQTWTSQTPDGRPTEIRPVTANVNYRGGAGVRNLKLSGALNYDGDIPGGYATGLETEGELNVRLGKTTDIFYKAKLGTSVLMQTFDNPTEWTASNVKFDLVENAQTPLFSTRDRRGKLTANVTNLSADLANSDRTRTLNFQFGSADISADIAEVQNWRIDGRDVVMTSEDTPTPGTEMRAPKTVITAMLKPGLSPEFTIEAPKADVKTQSVDAGGLAVQVAGTPEKFRVNYQNAQVDFSATDFERFQMDGYVDFENEQWVGQADTVLPFDKKTPVQVDYRFVDGRGYADVDIPELAFSPAGLQPQSFIPALQGKIADVRGFASARINLEFSEADGVVSSGTAKLIDMEMGTAPGPLRGLNSELIFSSFFPLVTKGPQTVTIDAWDVGFPLPQGVVVFEAIADGIRIDSARWPVGTGQISLDPTTWNYTAEENRMTLRVEDVSISEFIGDLGGDNFEATGSVSGVLPVVITGVDVQVENGNLAVKNGGVVRFSTPFTDKAGEANGYAQLAFDALKEFYYEELEVTLNGPLDGLINIKIVFEGFNPNVMDGAYIRYNLNIEGELLNIVRNFQRLGAQITEEVKSAVLGEDEVIN